MRRSVCQGTIRCRQTSWRIARGSTAKVQRSDVPGVTHLDQLDAADQRGPMTGPPVIPIVMLAITTLAAITLTIGAVLDDAGRTDEISTAAVLAWAFGSFLGLVVFAWFGSLDARRRATGRYVEPEWRPRAIGVTLAVLGWLAGAAGAFLVAQAVARR
jgi:hypothetical protein